MRILLWNVAKRRPWQALSRICRAEDVGIVVLAEVPGDAPAVTPYLNDGNVDPHFRLTTSLSTRITVWCRFDADLLTPIFETDYISIRRLRLPASPELLLVVSHLPSKLHSSPEDSNAMLRSLGDHIRNTESKLGHRRTILLGDLNANPFEAGMVAAGGLNATMSRSIAGKGQRTIKGTSYPYFYNPMWSLMGREDPGPPGSYFYQQSTEAPYFWHSFDQALFRPELIPCLSATPVRWLTDEPNGSMLNASGRPHDSNYSDHLPLLIDIQLERLGELDEQRSA